MVWLDKEVTKTCTYGAMSQSDVDLLVLQTRVGMGQILVPKEIMSKLKILSIIIMCSSGR